MKNRELKMNKEIYTAEYLVLTDTQVLLIQQINYYTYCHYFLLQGGERTALQI
jgi:hypothetical protein